MHLIPLDYCRGLHRHPRNQWCPGIAGEYTPGVDYEHEHRVAEHEHEEMPEQCHAVEWR